MKKYQLLRVKSIPWISYLKGTNSILYFGPKLSDLERHLLSEYPSIYLHDYFCDFWITQDKISYTYPGLDLPNPFTADTVFYAVRKTIKETTGINLDPTCQCLVKYDGVGYVVFVGNENIEYTISYLESTSYKRELLYKDSGRTITSAFKELQEDKIEWLFDECCTIEGDESVELIQNEVENNNVTSENDQGIAKENHHIQLNNAKAPRIEFCMGPAEDIDPRFDKEMAKVVDDVKRSIGYLLLNGIPAVILQSWITEQVKLSKLRITNQFKIIMVDYGKEAKMGPLPKTIFLFYLRHPEGVRFSYLQDHVKELMHIYERVSVNDDVEKMKESIMALIDPLNNSINEKCAAIKKAFLLQVNDDVAKNYYVTGMQGGAKVITLDRNLVEWECEL